MPIQLSAEQEGLQSLGRALREHADGKRIRRELGKNMRDALTPAVDEIKSGLMATSSGSVPTEGEPLRAGVAKKIKAEARFSGKATGARVRARKTQGIRGFANAAKRLNSAKGWRHPVYGTNTYVTQTGNPNYWDDPLDENQDQYRKAVLEVMENTAREIAQKGA